MDPTAGAPATTWLWLRVELPAEIAEAVANFLIETGAPGLVTEDHETAPRPPPAGRARLEAPVPALEHPRIAAALDRYLASLGTLHDALGPVTVASAPVPPVDWAALARRHHRPVAIGRRLLVAPPWEVPAGTGREVLVIEPAMAFGTGQHATTRGCLEAVEALVGAGGVGRALDVGTGTGILALALARLGVPRVVALDADRAVLAEARGNLARNGASHVLLAGGTVACVRERFDVVVANLLADALVAEAPALSGAVSPEGHLVVSGLLATEETRVGAAYPGWRAVAARRSEGWATLTLERDPQEADPRHAVRIRRSRQPARAGHRALHAPVRSRPEMYLGSAS